MQSAKFDLRKDVTTSKLEIKSTTCTMAGKYSCELSNLGGSAQSVIVYLTVSKFVHNPTCFTQVIIEIIRWQ